MVSDNRTMPKKTVRKKTDKIKRIAATGAAAAVLGLGFWASKAVYTVKSVIDGDTFVTTEDQYIRLDNIDAPEIGRCGSDESKKYLEKLVLNKKVFLKVSYLDGHRLIASAYTLDGNVAANMLKSGMAISLNKSNTNEVKKEGFTEISSNARNKKIGVFSDKCTQEKNSENPKCAIKGNVSKYGKFYRTPDCSQYKITILQLYLGDQWFCTEKEAQKAGFTKSPDCE